MSNKQTIKDQNICFCCLYNHDGECYLGASSPDGRHCTLFRISDGKFKYNIHACMLNGRDCWTCFSHHFHNAVPQPVKGEGFCGTT